MPSFIRWERRSNYVRVFSYADQTAWALNLIAFVAAIGAGLPLPLMELWFGQFTTAFVLFNAGHLSPEVFKNEVNKLSLYLVYLFIGKAICTYISAVCISIAAMRTTKELRIDFLKSLLRQEAAYFDLASGGRSPALHVTTTSAMVNQGIAESLSLVIQGVSTFSAAFVVAFATQWKLTLITLAIVPFVIFATSICVSLDARLDKRLLVIHSTAGHLAQEVFSSMTTIHAFFLHTVMSKKHDAILAQAEKQGMKKRPNQGFLFASDDFAIFCGYALAFHRGIRMYQSGEVEEVGEIVTVIFAMVVAATTLRQMGPHLLTMEKAASAADQLFEVIDKQSHIDSLSREGIQPLACLGSVRFEHVEFGYPSRPDVPVLRGLSLNIPAGKTTAIVGESGSGKSTIISLIQRCYDPDTGAIFLDGTNLAQLNLNWLRTNIRCVEQEPTLFSATIFENVSFGLVGSAHETAPQSEKMKLVEEACRIAFADDFIRDLPQGYSTPIDGRTLSGGQKQRIAIARSIISHPKVLVLDEATSALDATTEAKVLQALRAQQSSTTCILIAHKMSTIQHADNIIVFEKGNVSSHGSHQELLARSPTYARLVRAQEVNYTLGERAEREDELSVKEEEKNEKAMPIVTLSEVRPDDESTREYGILKTVFLLIQEQRGLWPLFMLLAFMCCLAAGIFTVQAIIFARTFEVFQDRKDAKAVSKADFWAMIFFLIALAQVLIWFTLGWGSIIVSQRLTRTYRQRLFESLVHHNIAFFDSHESGALTAKLSNAATNLQELMSVNMFLIWMNAINILCSSVFAVVSGWKLGLVCVFGALPPLVFSGYLRIRLEGQLERAASARFEESATIAAEAISAHQVVRSMTLEHTVLARYKTQLSGLSTRSIPKVSWIMLWYALSQSTQFLAFALGFWYGARLVLRGHYTATQFFEIFIAVLFGGEAAAMLFQYSSSISKAGIAANLMFQLEKTASRQHEFENRCRLDHDPKDQHHYHDQGPHQHNSTSVTFEALNFAYPSRPEIQILKGIDVFVPGGKFVAFVGRSGSGKSTLLNLFCRFYDPTSGRILVGGKSIYDIPVREHRREIGLVQQESQFYQGTIRENLLVEDEEAMELALTQANLWTFVKSLPEGLDTPIGVGGSRLSGGQKQRLAIARALVRQPRILLLDEATSALDPDSEKAVQGAILSAAEGRTTIAVAHRLSTIRNADLIYVFEHGRVVECGRHEALISRKERYYDMWQSQSMGCLD